MRGVLASSLLAFAALSGVDAQVLATAPTATAPTAPKKKLPSAADLDDDEYLDAEDDLAEGAAGGALDPADEIIIRSGPIPEGCTTANTRYEAAVLTDFIPLLKSVRECQNACQQHPECSYFSFYAGQPGELAQIMPGDEIPLKTAEVPYEEYRRLQATDEELPTAAEVLQNPQAGACFFFGPYVEEVTAQNFESAPRACATECSKLYSENCRTTKCCERPTATCVAKDSFFAQCRLPTDACPGRSWECRNITYYAQGCLEYDIEYAPTAFGNDIEEVLNVPGELSCQQLCKNHPRCNFWSYNPWYKQMCLLKKRAHPKRRAKGIISGRKDCIGMEQPNLVDYLKLNDPAYKTTLQFIEAAGLAEDLAPKEGQAMRTIFVPIEAAWKKLDENLRDAMLTNKSLARDILLTHVIGSVIYPERVIGTRSFAALTAVNGNTVGLSRRASDGDILRINKAEVLTSDYPVKGYLISTVDHVLLPNSVTEMLDVDFFDSLPSTTGSTNAVKPPAKAPTTGVTTTPSTTATTEDPREAARAIMEAKLKEKAAAAKAAAAAESKTDAPTAIKNAATKTTTVAPVTGTSGGTGKKTTTSGKDVTTEDKKKPLSTGSTPTTTKDAKKPSNAKTATTGSESKSSTTSTPTEKTAGSPTTTNTSGIKDAGKNGGSDDKTKPGKKLPGSPSTLEETSKSDKDKTKAKTSGSGKDSTSDKSKNATAVGSGKKDKKANEKSVTAGKESIKSSAIEEETKKITEPTFAEDAPTLALRVSDKSLSELESEPVAMREFVDGLRSAIGESLGTSANNVRITRLIEGSVIAEFQVANMEAGSVESAWTAAVLNPESAVRKAYTLDTNYPSVAAAEVPAVEARDRSAGSPVDESEVLVSETEEESSGLPVWAFLVIGLIVGLALIIAAAAVHLFRRSKQRGLEKRRMSGADLPVPSAQAAY